MMRMSRVGGVVASACLLAVLASAAVQAEGKALHHEVLKMLQSGLSEELILEWLPGAPAPAGPLSADELIALKEAGASEELLKELLERSRSAVTEPSPEPAAPQPATESAPAPAGGDPVIAFTLAYLARFEEPEPEWDLYVYLNGKPLGYLPSESLFTRPRKLEFSRSLKPGRHVIRVAQERHVRLGRDSWRHQARVAEITFEFELEPGTPAELELAFRQDWTDYRDPLSFRVTQGGRAVDSGNVGGDPELWPLLCEELELGFAEARQAPEGCIRWKALWDDPNAPSRSEVHRALALFDYRPVPKGS